MLGLSTAKLIGGGLALLIVGGMIFGFWNHYNSIVETNGILNDKVGKLETVLQTQDVTIKAQGESIQEFKSAAEEFKVELGKLSHAQAKAKSERDRLLDVFGDSDFEAILQARPESAKRLVNRGTRGAFRMLECASGNSDPKCLSSTGEAGAEAGSTKAPAN